MPIQHSKFFPESALAHQLLDGLKGLEIGGAAHNAFGLDTLNVDRISHDHPDFQPYASEQKRLCGAVMPVDIVAPGDCIPVDDQSFDFVISSHVIEHFFDPISAIKEWMRISRQYIFIICPQRDALESDRGKPLTELEDHLQRFKYSELKQRFLERKASTEEKLWLTRNARLTLETDEHHSRWTCQSFCNMCMWIYAQEWGRDWETCAVEPVDMKVGNGFTVVLKFKGE